METNKVEKVFENEENISQENNSSNVENADVSGYLEEDLDLGEETDIESKVSVVKNYSPLSQEELLDELKSLLETAPVERIRKDVEAIKDAFDKIVRADRSKQEQINIEEGEEIDRVNPVEYEFNACLKKYKDRRTAYIRNVEYQKEENYRRKLSIIEELKELTGEEENFNETFRKFHDIQNRWKEAGQVPQSHVKDLWETWHHNVEKFYDYVKINKELRDLDFKRNLETKKQIVEKARKLLELDSISDAFACLQTYHDEWREIGPVPKDEREKLWEQFKEVTSQINKKHQSYFDRLKAERVLNLQLKTELCERAEKLNSTERKSINSWQKAIGELTSILDEWKTVGFVPRKENTEIYARLKKARDQFFVKRREFFKKLKMEMSENLRIKKELCEKAEEVKNSENWKEATDMLIELQKQWKNTGFVNRKQSDILWRNFRAACDTFFNRKAEFFHTGSEYSENLREKEALLKELEEFDASQASIETLKQFRNRWNKIGFVPLKNKNKIQKRFTALLEEKHKNIDTSKSAANSDERRNSSRRENSQRRENPPKNERSKMFQRIAQLESEVALLENNVGFFASTKNAESLIAGVRSKINDAKKEIIQIEDQIKQIDSETE
ncbi:MAG: DUF349 domain-containing protein [Prevotellaceae bacterium]|jgi:hypothetical protein|nr:DUF349 domain-containing protein [Prevotellaceae bacterium]